MQTFIHAYFKSHGRCELFLFPIYLETSSIYFIYLRLDRCAI